MKYLIGLLCFFSVAQAQFAPTSAKTKFVNGIGIGSKDTSQFTAADTIALTIARDSVMYYRYRGFWRPIATGGNLSAYKLISDTLFANGYTTRARLKQGLDSLAATKGTVNSVGLTMPSAFNVANSPITSSGTIAVTAAGNATQYIRGDGALATLPTSGSGGGASVSYYLNGSVNQGTIGGVTYYEMNKTPIIGAGTDFSINADGYIASFLTDANDPALLKIPAGNWNFETYFSASSGGGSPTFYIELYKYNGTTFTLIASNSTSPKLISDGTNIEAYFSTLAVPETVLTLTDRLAVRIYVSHSGRTITLHTENGHLCQIITTFTTGLTALNGLTEQVQYFSTGTSGTDFNIASSVATHTFNLPTASATNRGALSSANWTTFNNKIGAGDTAAMLAPYFRDSDTTGLLSQVVRTFGAQTVGGAKTFTSNLIGTSAAFSSLSVVNTNGIAINAENNSSGFLPLQVKNSGSGGLAQFSNSGGVVATIGNGGAITGTSFIRSSGTSSQFLKADGSVDGTAYQAALTLTTTGTSGAATLVGATLNIPQYAAASGSTAYIQNGTSQQASSNFNISGLGRASSFQIGTFGNIDTSGANFRFNYYDGFAWVNFLSVNNTTGLVSTPQNVTLTGSASLTTSNIIGANIGIGKNYMSSFNDASIDMSRNGLTNSNILSFTTVSNSDSWQMGVIASAGSTREFSIRSGTSGKVFAIDYLTGAATFSGSISASNGTLIGGTGTTNYLPKFTGSTTVGNSALQEVSGNLGLGVIPSAWGVGKAIEVGAIGNHLWGVGGNSFYIGSNAYYDLSWKYATTGAAATYQSSSGEHRFFIAPSGTAGNAISFTQAMTLDASGRLGIGTTSPSSLLEIAGSAPVLTLNRTSGGNTNTINFNSGGTNYGSFISNASSGEQRYSIGPSSGWGGYHTFYTDASERMRITSGGNLLVGTTTDNGARLQVSGTGTFSSTLTVNSETQNVMLNLNSPSSGRSPSVGFSVGSSLRAGIQVNVSTFDMGLWVSNFAINALNLNGSTGAATFSSTLGINGVADNVKSGTYTPTVTIESGGGSSPSANVCRWIRVGNIVTVTGNIYFQPQGSGYVTKDNIIRITYPIARTSTGICSGPISAYPVGGVTANVSGYVFGTSTSWAQLYIKTEYSGSGCEPYFTFSYEVD